MKEKNNQFRSSFGGILLVAVVVLCGFAVSAQTHSDFNKKFTFVQFASWNFANERVNARDKFGFNEIWDNYLRQDLTAEFVKLGFTHSDENPDLVIKYRLGTQERERVNVFYDDWPGYMYHRGGWVYWRGGLGWGTSTVFRTRYDESTLVVDIIDTKTGELVWRGYDRRTIDGKSEKTLKKSVEKLMGRFAKDVRESRKTKG